MSKLYSYNRARIAECLDDNSVCVLFAGRPVVRSGDAHYYFYVNRNFFYLTGINRDKHVLLLVKRDGKLEATLFLERFDEEKSRRFANFRPLREPAAAEISGIDKFMYLDELKDALGTLLFKGGLKKIYLDLGKIYWDGGNSPEALALAKELEAIAPALQILDITDIIGALRAIKSGEEVSFIREGISITREAILAVLRDMRPGLKEYEIATHLEYMIRRKDTALGSGPIVAAGKNATLLHYHPGQGESKRGETKDGELVLFDFGANWNNYTADITRTFPVSGKFTERQKLLYGIVLEANMRTIAAIKPGMTFQGMNTLVREFYAEELKKIGLIKDKDEVSKYFYHNVGHPIGLETHDVGGSRDMKPGMVFTVEPGLYIYEEGIGIRIEDNVLVTENGCENLSKNIVKTVEDVEKLMSDCKKAC